MNLHFPDLDPNAGACRAPSRRPVAVWMLVALILAVLGGALVAASTAHDTRTFAERHGFVPTGARAL